MGRYRSIQATLIEIALKGITDNQTVTAYKKDCKGHWDDTGDRKWKIYEVLIQYDYFIQRAMGVLIMDYRKEIVEMINRIQSEKVLRYIYIIIADIPKRYWR